MQTLLKGRIELSTVLDLVLALQNLDFLISVRLFRQQSQRIVWRSLLKDLSLVLYCIFNRISFAFSLYGQILSLLKLLPIAVNHRHTHTYKKHLWLMSIKFKIYLRFLVRDSFCAEVSCECCSIFEFQMFVEYSFGPLKLLLCLWLLDQRRFIHWRAWEFSWRLRIVSPLHRCHQSIFLSRL